MQDWSYLASNTNPLLDLLPVIMTPSLPALESKTRPSLLSSSAKPEQKSWTAVMRKDAKQLAEVTETDWTNGHMAKKWLEKVSDPYTEERIP